jgi:prephenate dehydratase
MTIINSPIVAFQGVAGAYSDLVSRTLFPTAKTLPCAAFEDVFASVTSEKADVAVIPVENSVAGRVADVYHLLPDAGLFIHAQHFQKITHCLLGVKGARVEDITAVHSHVQGLSQCRTYLRDKGLTPIVHVDTAGAAKDVALWGDKTKGAIASSLAAEIYGLDILDSDIADAAHNTTRFLVLTRDKAIPVDDGGDFITTLVFETRSVPAALYKALGGFATNGVNLSKIESYLLDGNFNAVQFYVDVESHPERDAMRHALEELRFFSKDVRVLGVYRKARNDTEYLAASPKNAARLDASIQEIQSGGGLQRDLL